MKTTSHNVLKFLNRALYFISIAMLISGMVLSVAAKPAMAATGSVWTTDVCGTGAQDANHYAVGAHVYVNYSGLGAGSHTWTITYTNKTGKPIVSVAGAIPAVQGTGSVSGNAGCFDAWVVQPEEAGYVFKIDVDGKQDSYGVDALVPTTPAPTTPAPTTPAPTTPAPTTPAPTTPAPTTPAPTETTPAPTETTPAPTVTTPAPTETTPAPTETTPAPTVTTPAPTETTPAPTETTPAPTVTTPAPTVTTPAPTQNTPAPTQSASPTVVASLPIPATGGMVLIPVTGADVSSTLPGNASRGLMLNGLSFFGVAMVITGLRRKFDL